MHKEEARQLFDEIKAGFTDLAPKIMRFFENQAWAELGYQSWDDLCNAELPGWKIPMELRRETVRELHNSGMSQNAIAKAVNVARSTVQADLANGHKALEGADNRHPAERDESSPTVVGVDGKTYQASVVQPNPVESEDMRKRKISEEELHIRSSRLQSQHDRAIADRQEKNKIEFRSSEYMYVEAALAIAQREIMDAVKHSQMIDYNFTTEEREHLAYRKRKIREFLEIHDADANSGEVDWDAELQRLADDAS